MRTTSGSTAPTDAGTLRRALAGSCDRVVESVAHTRVAVSERLWPLAFALLIAVASPPAFAEPEAESAPDRDSQWAVVATLGAGVWFQQVTASVAGRDLADRFAPFGNENSNATVLRGIASGELQILSPAAYALPGQPRLALHTGLALPIGGSTVVSSQVGDFSRNTRNPTISVGVDPRLAWSLGMGVSVELPTPEVPIAIETSLLYLGQSVTWEHEVRHAVDTALSAPILTFADSRRQLYHGIGVRLKVSTDLAEMGAFTPSVFLLGQYGAWLSGNRSGSFAVDAIVRQDSLTSSSRYRLERDHFLVTAGLQLKWFAFE